MTSPLAASVMLSRTSPIPSHIGATPGRLAGPRAATWRIRYMPGVTELMRVVDDERRVWGIIGLAVVGFNHFHDLICQSDGTRLPEPEPGGAKSGPPQEKEPLPKPTRAE